MNNLIMETIFLEYSSSEASFNFLRKKLTKVLSSLRL